MINSLMVGIGAAGNKAALEALEQGIFKEEDIIMINSTSKDFPEEFGGTKIVLSSKDTGCGKERKIGADYALQAIKAGKLNIDIKSYSTVIIATSVEGGTGSGSSPIIAKYFNQVFNKNVHVFAFAGFEDDVRGMRNTVEFFQEIDPNLTVHAIRNKEFMRECSNNKFRAEQAANAEMVRQIRVLTGMDFINSEQNIDDTDILKVSNTSGYEIIEKTYLDKPLVDQDDFNRVIKKMIYNSKSVQVKEPKAIRIGIILNIDPASEDAIDYTFESLKASYGNPFESYMQKQWDGKKEYIAFIVSGMMMPLDAVKETYDKYKEATSQINKNSDNFFKEVSGLELDSEDDKFNMIKPTESGTSIEDFLKGLETK